VISDETEQLKRLTIIALFSEDQLVDRLVLKGANALNLAHGLTSRASFDLDFSMDGAFEADELASVIVRIESRLKQEFKPAGYVVLDVRLEPKPENISPELEDFWGGYNLEFKVIRRQRYDELEGNLAAIRKQAIPMKPGGRACIEVDISRHEYCRGKQAVEIDQFTVYVYTPAMIVCEKIRAICQQTPRYAKLVKRHRSSPRARDFFDIHETVRRFDIDLLATENVQLLRHMFQAKRVPLELLLTIEQQRDFHRQDWDAVRDTVDTKVRLHDFDVYFEFVVGVCRDVAHALRLSPLGT